MPSRLIFEGSYAAMATTLDDIDKQIIALLARHARATIKEIASHTGLSSPSASERLRRLEERGVIESYGIELNAESLGYAIEALVHIAPAAGTLHIVERMILETPQIVECDKVTGDDCFIARVVAHSVQELETVLSAVSTKSRTNSSIVKGKTMKRRLPPL